MKDGRARKHLKKLDTVLKGVLAREKSAWEMMEILARRMEVLNVQIEMAANKGKRKPVSLDYGVFCWIKFFAGMLLGAVIVGFAWYLCATHTPNQAASNPVKSPATAPINAHDNAVFFDDVNSRSNFLRSSSYSRANRKGSPSLILDSSMMMNPSSRLLAVSNHDGVSRFDCASMSFKRASLTFCSCDRPDSSTSSRYISRISCHPATISTKFEFFKYTDDKEAQI